MASLPSNWNVGHSSNGIKSMPNYVLDSNQALAHRLSHSANALKGAI
jgi:hypothetical protein